MTKPEKKARVGIDRQLEEAGWVVQDRDKADLTLPAVAVREVPLAKGHGFADYLLYADGRPIGVTWDEIVSSTRREPDPDVVDEFISTQMPEEIKDWLVKTK